MITKCPKCGWEQFFYPEGYEDPEDTPVINDEEDRKTWQNSVAPEDRPTDLIATIKMSELLEMKTRLDLLTIDVEEARALNTAAAALIADQQAQVSQMQDSMIELYAQRERLLKALHDYVPDMTERDYIRYGLPRDWAKP